MLGITGTRPPSTPAAEWLINMPLLIWFVFSWFESYGETKRSAEKKYEVMREAYDEAYSELLEHAWDNPDRLPVEHYRGYCVRYNFKDYAVYEGEGNHDKAIVAYSRMLDNGESGMVGALEHIDSLADKRPQKIYRRPEADQPD